jgi:putative CocE/NonD family hydrolase
MQRGLAAPLLVLLMVGSVLAGCIGTTRDFYEFRPGLEYRNPAVFPGNYSHVDGNGSYILHRGFLPYGDPEVVRLRSPRGAGVTPGQVSENEAAVWISMAVWRPIDGFLNETIPIIVDAGPYYEVGDYCPGTGGSPPCPPGVQALPRTINVPGQRTGFLLKNFLPHGYAVVQLAVRGTGTSGGCMELMGPNEAADLNMAIDWLANQEWSNGNVSMIGVSYDGSTPWMVAAMGNEHLKAIVPISGLPDAFDLMFRNGTSETRATSLYQNYWTYGFGRTFPHPNASLGPANDRSAQQNRQNLLCPEAYEGFAAAQYSSMQGDRGTQFTDFWSARDYRARVLKNYEGSVFLVHGLQDWNVDPYVVIPFNQQLRDKGLDVREWYGQWGHTTPDGQCSKNVHRFMISPCRYDFAEVLFRYLNFHLKGNTSAELGPPIQVQDNRGYWRIVDSYPAMDASWLRLHPTLDGKLAPVAGADDDVVLLPPPPPGVETVGQVAGQRSLYGPVHWIEMKSDPFPEDTRISGTPRLHVQFEAMGEGGFLGAWLFDENEAGEVADRLVYIPQERLPVHASKVGGLPIVGHAQMDLRYHAGGETRQTLQPGTRYTARMEFEPLDVLVPKGDRLTLWVLQYPYPDKSQSPAPTPVRLWLGGATSTLDVPLITVDPRDIFAVPGAPFPREKDYPRYYAEKPNFDQVIAPVRPPGAAREAAPLLPFDVAPT